MFTVASNLLRIKPRAKALEVFFISRRFSPQSCCFSLNVWRVEKRYMSSEPKRFCTKDMAVKNIGTHNGTFHCDEVLACFFLRQIPEYKASFSLGLGIVEGCYVRNCAKKTLKDTIHIWDLFSQSAILDDNNEFKRFLANAVDVLDQFSSFLKTCSRQGLYCDTPHSGAVIQKGYHKYASLQIVIITDYIINLFTITDIHLITKEWASLGALSKIPDAWY